MITRLLYHDKLIKFIKNKIYLILKFICLLKKYFISLQKLFKMYHNMRIARIVNRRSGLATNSSSTHSVIYKNKGDVFGDLNIFDERYYDRCTRTIAASREAKIRYIFGNCFRRTELVELLQERYPEIKQYYPMVKDYYEKYCTNDYKVTYDESLEDFNFGDHCRGELYNKEDIHMSYKVLCNIIDSPDIVIIGGSDEEDFVYDTCKGHDEYLFSNFRYMESVVEKYKNGNYYVVYGERWGKKDKTRLAVEEGTLCPEVPELVDMKITNACEHGCPFCYMNSTKNGEHADFKTIQGIVKGFKNKTEFALGGGNVLLHPQFPQIVEYIKNMRKNHIVNITIRYDDIHRINDKSVLKDAIIDHVDGIGISVQKVSDLSVVESFAKEMMLTHNKHISIHIIPELLGYYKSIEILKEMSKCNRRINGYDEKTERYKMKNYIPMKALFLGLKQVGRASSMSPVTFTKDELTKLVEATEWQYCIDTAFINTYREYYEDWYEGDENFFVTRNEGEFSMYIDAITATAYKSSYDTTNGFPIEMAKYWDSPKTIEPVFAEIRKQCGFKVYEPKRKYYE